MTLGQSIWTIPMYCIKGHKINGLAVKSMCSSQRGPGVVPSIHIVAPNGL